MADLAGHLPDTADPRLMSQLQQGLVLVGDGLLALRHIPSRTQDTLDGAVGPFQSLVHPGDAPFRTIRQAPMRLAMPRTAGISNLGQGGLVVTRLDPNGRGYRKLDDIPESAIQDRGFRMAGQLLADPIEPEDAPLSIPDQDRDGDLIHQQRQGQAIRVVRGGTGRAYCAGRASLTHAVNERVGCTLRPRV